MTTNKSKRFQIEVITDRKIVDTIYTRNPDRKETNVPFVVEQVETIIPESYLVYFPSGHSLWFRSKEQMHAAGIASNANFEIDLATGMAVEPENDPDLKAVVLAKTRNAGRHAHLGE